MSHTTDPVLLEIMGQTIAAEVTWPTPASARQHKTTVSFDAEATSPGEEPIPVRVVVTFTPSRTLYAAVAPDTSGVWAIGDTIAQARAGALERRQALRDPIVVGDDFPDASTDAEWLDAFTIVTMTGTTEALRAVVANLGDVIPWCPADLWESEPVKEP